MSGIDTQKELEMWKRVIRGALGDIVYRSLETVVKRELAKGESQLA